MSITEDALARLQELIVSGELAPGSRLPPEPELASRLGVSRGSMREAVRALSHMRLIEVRRGCGTFVTALEPAGLLDGVRIAAEAARDDAIFDIFQVRRLLEPAAAGMAATRASATQLDELRADLVAMRTATTNPAEFMRHDEAFHDRIATIAGNPWLAALLRGLAAPATGARTRRLGAGQQVPQLTITQHEQIFGAIASGDSALAEATALLHIATTAEGLRALLQQATENELEGR
ncbi:MAG TPA: FCD domain-containing protein [Trebonia sp.]|jgi:GntR family transcriptional repressor for pyruvate dehydrogenase complex